MRSFSICSRLQLRMWYSKVFSSPWLQTVQSSGTFDSLLWIASFVRQTPWLSKLHLPLLRFSCSWDKMHAATYQAFENIFFGQKRLPGLWQQWEPRQKHILLHHFHSFLSKQPRRTLYPKHSHSPLCTMMLLFNLAKSHWISVPCNMSLLPCTVCWKEGSFGKNQNKSDVHLFPLEFCCTQFAFITNQSCFLFQWFDGTRKSNNLKDLCLLFAMKPKGFGGELAELNAFLLAAKHTHFHLLFPIPYNSSLVHEVSFKMIWMNVSITLSQRQITISKGFLICSGKMVKMHVASSNMYLCQSGEYVSSIFVLNGKNDCQNFGNSMQSTDEKCPLHNFTCPLKCYVQGCVCSPLHYKSREGFCLGFIRLQFEKHKTELNVRNKSTFLCEPVKKKIHLDVSLVNDLIPDCPLADDEMLYKL